jgi:phosphoglycolate phosphatase
MTTAAMRTPDTSPALLIDLDGTLVDSAPDIAEAANRMLRELGAPILPFETIRGFIGRGVPNLVRRVLASSDTLSAVSQTDAQAIFHKHYGDTNGRYSAIFPGVLAGLASFRGAGHPLACVTNKPRMQTAALLRATGLDAYFDVVVAGDSLPQMKPDPAPLRFACDRLGIDARHSVMIGDSEVDVAAAAAAGIPVYIVSYGYPGPGGLAALPAARIIDSFSELPALLAERHTHY